MAWARRCATLGAILRPVARFDRTRILSVPEPMRARRSLVLDLFEAGLDAVEPSHCVARAIAELRREGVALGPAVVFAFGKAAIPMARAALAELEVRRGIVIAPLGNDNCVSLDPLELYRGTHPRPSPRAPAHARRALELARSIRDGEIAIALVSGGGSALFELPRDPLAIEDLDGVTSALMARGAAISEMNAVRTALSAVKGGGLASEIAPRPLVTLVLSDVPGLPAELVASGPASATVASEDPRAILARYRIDPSSSVRSVLSSSRPVPRAGPVRTVLCADNDTARRAIVEEAARRGVRLVDRPGYFSGIARELVSSELWRDGAFVWGGETTVRVAGAGRGGRNQEVVLSATGAGLEGTFACLGTDGIDGASDAAGALLDRHAIAEARRLGLDPERALADNASHDFFERLGTQLRTGPTGTNVADVCIYLDD